jgi:hypothetical protein
VIPSGDHGNHLKEFSKNPNKGYYKHAPPKQNPTRKENQGNKPVPKRLKLQANRQNPRNQPHNRLGSRSKNSRSNLPAKNPRSQKTAELHRS